MDKDVEKFRILKIIATWLKQWNKPLAAFVAFLLFSTMFVTTVIEVIREHRTIANESGAEFTTGSLDVEDRVRDGLCYVETDCTVRCKNIVDEAMANVINEQLDEDTLNCKNTLEIKLYIEDAYFTNNTISNGWLKGLSKDVGQLTISSQQLTELGESAFGGSPFEYLKSLVIADSRIRTLRRESFINSKIETFELRCTNIITVEYDALGPVSDYLTILQLSRCIEDIESIRNITSTESSVFNKLIELDLRYNTFNKVTNNTFVGAPRLVSLYLIENNIAYIEVGGFKGTQNSLQLLSLKDNKLRTLPNGVFNGFVNGHQIDITGNPWNCNCSLQWFKDFYIQNLDKYFENGNISFICTEGNYSDINFCPDSSTYPTLPTDSSGTTKNSSIHTTSTLKPTTTPGNGNGTTDPIDYIYLECKDLTLETPPVSSVEGRDRLYSHTVTVRHGTISYNFYQIEGTPNFEIKVLNNIGSDYLIWINSKNSSDYGCVHNVQEIVELDNLHYGMSYTICLLKESTDTVTPFDCTSLTVPLEWPNLAWVQNKYMPAVIGGIVGTAIALILITSLIIFYTIRQNPKLIKGNKRVVIVRNKSADALVMPNYERQPYIPPSIYTNSAGYLTPRQKMYERVNERRFRHLNTITEKFYRDMYNESGTSFRPESFHRRSVGSGVYEAPPLPPNHPSERARSSPRPHTSFYK